MVSMNANLAVYHGPPSGLYDFGVFDEFARKDFSDRLKEMGLSGDCRSRTYKGWTLYDFSGANLKLWHKPLSPERCEVDLIGPPSSTFLEMLAFTMEEATRVEARKIR